jgi:hypothetical protein
MRPLLKVATRCTFVDASWNRCYDFKNIFAKKMAIFLHFWLKTKLKFDHNIGFKKTHIFSPKIVIITSTPGHRSAPQLNSWFFQK